MYHIFIFHRDITHFSDSLLPYASYHMFTVLISCYLPIIYLRLIDAMSLKPEVSFSLCLGLGIITVLKIWGHLWCWIIQIIIFSNYNCTLVQKQNSSMQTHAYVTATLWVICTEKVVFDWSAKYANIIVLKKE